MLRLEASDLFGRMKAGRLENAREGWLGVGEGMRGIKGSWDPPQARSYCAVRKIGDSPSRTAQSGGESDEGRRSAPLGRVRGEG